MTYSSLMLAQPVFLDNLADTVTAATASISLSMWILTSRAGR